VDVGGCLEGIVLLAAGAFAIRYRDSVARAQIANRVETLDRSSFLDPERADEQKRSLRTPGSLRLSTWLVTAGGAALVLIGLAAIVAAFI
jgi:hypothetical protein